MNISSNLKVLEALDLVGCVQHQWAILGNKLPRTNSGMLCRDRSWILNLSRAMNPSESLAKSMDPFSEKCI